MVSKEQLDAMLKAQREAYNDTISHLVTNFENRLSNTNEQLAEVKRNFENLKRDSADQAVLIEDLKREIFDLKNPLTELKSVQEEASKRVDYLEDQSRRNNLRFVGFKEEKGETWEHVATKVKNLIKNQIGIDKEIPIERAHRVGQTAGERPRTIVAKFRDFDDKNNILRNAKNLKGTNLYINEDLCEASRAKRKEQLPKLKQARSEGKIAFFSHTRLIIKDKSTIDGSDAPISSGASSSSSRVNNSAQGGSSSQQSSGKTGPPAALPPSRKSNRAK